MYLLLLTGYAFYLGIVCILFAIFWGIAKLFYRDTHMKRWHWVVFALILALPLIYFVVGTVYHKATFDREAFIEERIEWATKVDFPEFKIKKYEKGGVSFNGDYMDNYVLEFEEVPRQEFYDQLEALCNEPDSTGEMHWSKQDHTHYSWGGIWGNGTPNPDGEETEEDAFLNVHIEKGKRKFKVSEGMW